MKALFLSNKRTDMIEIIKLTFNPFQENTYILYDDSKECVIIDPGCYTQQEKEQLLNAINGRGLKPVKLINTHCHIDHVFGMPMSSVNSICL